MQDTPPPMPGRMPMPTPMRAERTALGIWVTNSLREKPKPRILTELLISTVSGWRTFSAYLTTSVMAKMPMSSTSSLKPAVRFTLSKVKRGLESMGARPTVASMAPMTAEMRPLGRSLPVRVMTRDREKMVSAQYSKGPNFRATEARKGLMTTSSTTPMMVPRKENTTPVPRALAACPFSAMGRPSKQVATEEGVPGMFSRMAEIRPPEMPPMYRATSMEMPWVDCMA